MGVQGWNLGATRLDSEIRHTVGGDMAGKEEWNGMKNPSIVFPRRDFVSVYVQRAINYGSCCVGNFCWNLMRVKNRGLSPRDILIYRLSSFDRLAVSIRFVSPEDNTRE